MPISRRIFMRTGTMVVLGAAAHSTLAKVVTGQKSSGRAEGSAGFCVPAASMDDPLSYYTKATFMAHLNSKFRLRQGDSSSSVVTLVKVVDFAPSQGRVAVKAGGQADNRECFSLVFSGVKSLPQATYTVEHGSLGTFKLLLVPSGKAGGTPQLDAVINRLFS
jgi:hypothetical protein